MMGWMGLRCAAAARASLMGAPAPTLEPALLSAMELDDKLQVRSQ
jgi:hypothetical protein